MCLVERNLDPFSAIQEHPETGALMQGCPFGAACSEWRFQVSVAGGHPGVREST